MTINTEEGQHLAPVYLYRSKSILPFTTQEAVDKDNEYYYNDNSYEMDEVTKFGYTYHQPNFRFSLDVEYGECDFEAEPKSLSFTSRNLLTTSANTEEGEHLAPLYRVTRKATLPAEDEIIRYDYMMFHMCELIDIDSFTYYQPSRQRRRRKKEKLPLEQQEPPVETTQAKSIDDDSHKEEHDIYDMDEPTENGSIDHQPSIPEETKKQLPLEELEPPVETIQAKSIDDDSHKEQDIYDMDEPTENGSIAHQPSIPEETTEKLPLEELEPSVETIQAKSSDDDLCDKYHINDVRTIINNNSEHASACDHPSIPEEDQDCLAPEKSEAKPKAKARCKLFRWLFCKTANVNTNIKSERRKKPRKGSLRGGLKNLFCCG